MRENILKMNPSTLHDIQKYHKEAWDKYIEFKHGFIKSNVENNLRRGVKEGYYRQAIDPEVMAIYRMEQVQLLFDDKIFPHDKFDFAHVQLQMFDHFVHGILTEKGRELYLNFQKEESQSIALT
jgi:hypothetical protein